MPKRSARRDPPPQRRSNWSSSDRRSRLPADWPKIRKLVLRRDDHECQQRMPDGGICGDQASDVDHIRRGDDHRLENLRAMCRTHHRRKSSAEGGQGKAAARKKINASFRTTEEHPGLA